MSLGQTSGITEGKREEKLKKMSRNKEAWDILLE
jgi:hypothetical protein